MSKNGGVGVIEDEFAGKFVFNFDLELQKSSKS